jgi:hypothetical protein
MKAASRCEGFPTFQDLISSSSSGENETSVCVEGVGFVTS